MTNTKRSLGQFFTVCKSPFELEAFQEWANEVNLPSRRILEPFAGANNIIKSLQSLKLCKYFSSFDIHPADREVSYRDTLESFPTEFSVCVTNPPWLARNSATRRNLPFPSCQYDDIYKYCLELCLQNCQYVAALVPASFLQSGLFRERLSSYILLHGHLFNDTENPVCLALFSDKKNSTTKVFYDDMYVGQLEELESSIPRAKRDQRLRFNDPNGQLGFISFDNTREPSIRFCHVGEIEAYEIKHTSRFITRISGDFGSVSELVTVLNDSLNTFRNETHDIFLTPFKGVRADGRYRRRMFYAQARELINAL